VPAIAILGVCEGLLIELPPALPEDCYLMGQLAHIITIGRTETDFTVVPHPDQN